jgi:MFS family permease
VSWSSRIKADEIGLFIAAIVNNGTKNRNDTGSYRIPVAIQFAWSTILVVGLIFLPETPRFLIKQGRPDKAARSLSKLRRLSPEDPALLEELREIEANFHIEQRVGQAGYAECFQGTIGKRLLTGCLLQSLQQLTGVNFIFYYGTQYFKNANFQNPFIIQVITNSVNVISTFPGLYMVEKMGRRNLLLFGAIGTCLDPFRTLLTRQACACASSSWPVLARRRPRSRSRRSVPPSRLCAYTSSSSPARGAPLPGSSPVSCSRSRCAPSACP